MRNTTTYLDSSRQTRNTHLWREQVVLPRGGGHHCGVGGQSFAEQGVQATQSVRSFLAPAFRRACPLALGHFGRAKDG